MGRLDDIQTALKPLKKSKKVIYISTSEQIERNSYYQSRMGHIDDIQTALKP